MEQSYYIIRGSVAGRERLRIMARVMRSTTISLLERAGIRPGLTCLDVGCGGGDVSLELARIVGSEGRVVAIDRDEAKIELACREAMSVASNVEFRVADICEDEILGEFDLLYVRFLLTHLPHPDSALRRMRRALRPGGVIIAVDIDFHGYFCYPESPAFERYLELYVETVRRRGGDPYIGPRLPELLTQSGFEQIEMSVVQPAGLDGEVKLLTPITMENIADAVMAEGLASKEEIEQLISDLYVYARTPGTIGATPRIVEAWGRRPTA